MQQQQLPRNHHCCPHQQPQHDYHHHHHHQHHQYYHHQRPPVRFDQPYLARRGEPALASQLFTRLRHLTQGLHFDASRHHPYLSTGALPTGHSRSACHLQFLPRLLQQSQPRQVSYSSPPQRPSDPESSHAEPKFVIGPREQEGICPRKDQSTQPNGGSFPTPRYGQDPSSNDTALPRTSHTPKPNHSPPPPSIVTTSFYNRPPPAQTQTLSKPKGPPKCPHGKRRAQCLSCYDLGQGGGSICLHRRRRDLCPFCRNEILHGRIPPSDGRSKTRIRGPKTYVPRPPPPPPMPVLGGRGRRRTCVAAEVAVTEAGGVPAPPGTVVETEKMVQTRCSNQFSVETLIGPKTAQEASAVPQARPESPAQVVEQESFDRKSFEDRDAGAFTQSPFLSNRESFREAFKPSPSLITLSLSSISPSFSAETWQEDPIIRQALRADAYALAVEREREGCRRFEGSPTPEIETNERII